LRIAICVRGGGIAGHVPFIQRAGKSGFLCLWNLFRICPETFSECLP
jgi:hypothetical protein